METEKTAFIIVSYNSEHLLRPCVESIRDTVPCDRYGIVVVDNASTDGVTGWLESQKDVILVKNDTNVGFAPACNQGVAATVGTDLEDADLFFLNNDTRLAQGTFENLERVLYESEDIGAVGAVSNYAGNDQQIDLSFDHVEDYLEFGRRLCEDDSPGSEERVRLSGFAMFVKRSVWNRIPGGFDEDFAPGYFEDDALSMQILQLGFRLKAVRNAFVYHAGSQSFSKRSDTNSLLISHQKLFRQKFGFDILEYAYPNPVLLRQIPFHREDEFTVVQMKCGLGADLKMLRGIYPNARLYGIEPDPALYRILQNTEHAFPDIDSAVQSLGRGSTDLLIWDPKACEDLSDEMIDRLASLCRQDAVLAEDSRAYRMFEYGDIKAVIWDLDDTLWTGTLSEGEVSLSSGTLGLIGSLADHGIINSISSRNDEVQALERLDREGIRKFFVFNDINWENKGAQISAKIKRMGLRPENVLFIDDNPHNLSEAQSMCPGLLCADPGIMDYLSGYYEKKTPKDVAHTRLEQYKILEKKTVAESVSTSKEEFLRTSEIRICVHHDCYGQIDRITELVGRTNQLNYTKRRDTKDAIDRLIGDDWNKCGYISVRDRFGDYGIAGFYCYNTREKKLLHFLFSCRVMGMGIEQYVYGKLGFPDLEIISPVAAPLDKETIPDWITEEEPEETAGTDDRNGNDRSCRIRILLKGPCDLSAIEPYLSGGAVTSEFNYVDERGVITTGQNHSLHLWESRNLSESEIREIIKSAPFLSEGDFTTRLFSDRYHVVCYSLLQDCASGLYRNKATGNYASFGSRALPLTDPGLWPRFMDGSLQNHNYPFTEEVLRKFSSEWEFIGNTPIELLLRDLDDIYENMPGNPLFILILGSEKDYVGESEEFSGLADVYRQINPVIREFASDLDRVRIVNIGDHIRSQEDYTDCINHFARNVYYEIAGAIAGYINELV